MKKIKTFKNNHINSQNIEKKPKEKEKNPFL